MGLSIVVMAAGMGTRMRSARPKVLHRLAGRALLQHVLASAGGLGAERTLVVVGHGAEQVEASLAGLDGVRAVLQRPQLGTGHAVQQAAPHLGDDAGTTLVLNGDTPLLETATLEALVGASGGERLALLTVELDDPAGYGRIVRDGAPGRSDERGAIRAIVEQKDASDAERAIREVYTGVLAAPTAALRRWLGALRDDNAAGEFYLTDVVALAVAEGTPVVGVSAADETEVLGINSPAQLADLERRFQRREAERLLAAGVRLADPARLDVRGTLACGRDVDIDVGCVFEGTVSLGDGVSVGPYCVLRDVEVAPGAQLQAFTHADGATVGPDARVGPFARLRAGARLGSDVHVGNFVEIKQATLGPGAKANHLAYVGDATLGARVNFGAGAITANYDGAHKHRTTIGDDAHVGSNCVLVAPVTVGAGATIGGGSTIAKDAPAGQLTVARARAASYPNWTRPTKAAKAATATAAGPVPDGTAPAAAPVERSTG